MSFTFFKRATALALALSALCAQAGNAPFPLAMVSSLLSSPAITKADDKNLIMVLDVKQQEYYLGACGYIMATALQDKVAPMIASAHALSMVTSYFKPTEWHIYKKDNLVLFIPKQYLQERKISSPLNAGFILDGWREIDVTKDTLSGSEFYSSLNEPEETRTFADLSESSTELIRSTLKNDKSNKWKVYVVGHGAPDAHQVCGLNLVDFKKLLATLEDHISTDFLVYQTCFGGSTNQLRSIYTIGDDKFQTFSFPIVSGCLTNSVSFGAHPSKVSFKGIFSRVNNSMIMENKMRRLLKSVNELNRCLDYASEYHWANNLLTLRMPGSEYFEPVVDNKSVFKASAMPAMTEKLQMVCGDETRFKCVLFDKPVIQQSVDVSGFKNFMIASGISRPKTFVKELILPVSCAQPSTDSTLVKIAELFSSLVFPQESKTFYIQTLKVDNTVYDKVTLTQQGNGSGWSPEQYVGIQAISNGIYYAGMIHVGLNSKEKPIVSWSDIKPQNETDHNTYEQDYRSAVLEHLSKKHILPFHIVEEIFSVLS